MVQKLYHHGTIFVPSWKIVLQAHHSVDKGFGGFLGLFMVLYLLCK